MGTGTSIALLQKLEVRTLMNAANKKKILIVEDSADSRELLVLCVRRLGFDVWAARDGIEALMLAAAVHPDLIIMDISMPRMNGLQAMVRFKNDPATRNIPVVITTAHVQRSLIDRAVEVGALDVLIKPLDFTNLGKTLGQYLNSEIQTEVPIGHDNKNEKTSVSQNLD